jgi:Cyclic nucleotide-binding domain
MAALAAIALAGSLAATPCTDRSVKLTLIDHLSRSPQVLVLGSSRARQVDPSFLRGLTGGSGFNAAVTGGTAADAWVMTRYLADRFGRQNRGYLWFVDAGIATNGINPQLMADPRARPYLGGERSRSLGSVSASPCAERSRYRSDGSIAHPSGSFAPPARLAAQVARRVSAIRANPPRGGRVDPKRYVWFERDIQFMNEQGARPVIVLNPIHPRILAEFRKFGFPARKTALAYLRGLHTRLDFVVVDAQDIRRWRGSPTEWTNATHINRRNMRRLLRYVVTHSEGALRSRRAYREATRLSPIERMPALAAVARRARSSYGRRVRTVPSQRSEASASDARGWTNVLAEVPLFAGLSRRHLNKVAALGKIRRIHDGANILVAGEPGETMYVLLDGEVSVHRQGRPTITRGTGSFFGEMALLDGSARSATVVANGPVVCLTIRQAGFLKLLRKEPGISVALLKELAARLRAAEATNEESGAR